MPKTLARPIDQLTAADLMTRDPITIPQHAALREALELLLHNQLHGAPVVDEAGRCVGVLSLSDFARHWGEPVPAGGERLLTCQYLHKLPGECESYACNLPPGACPLQRTRDGDGGKQTHCAEPHCVLADWQQVFLEAAPGGQARAYMTADPVLVSPETTAPVIARRMVDARVQRVIVADERGRPIGIVSSTNLIAALARSVAGPEAG